MNVSIVLPVYNGEETLKKSLESIFKIDYPKENYELIIVNDGSKDNSDSIIKEFIKKNRDKLEVKYHKFEKNQGRIKARLKGVDLAKNDNLLFLDHRGEPNSDILKQIEKKEYQPIIGNLYQDKYKSLASNFFYVLRKIIYHPYWGNKYPDVMINQKNFSKVSKGFNPFFCSRTLLLRHLPKKKDKNTNDDTLIFSEIIKEKDILKTADCKVQYDERSSLKEFVQHLYNRAPRFVDFYFKPESRYFPLIIILAISPLLLCILLLVIIQNPIILLICLLFLIIAITITFIKYKLEIRDLLSIVIYFPLVWIVFTTGIWKGIYIKGTIKNERY